MNKENKITIIAGRRPGPHLADADPVDDGRGLGHAGERLLHVLGAVPAGEARVRITGDNWMQKMLSVMNPGTRRRPSSVDTTSPAPGPA